MGGRSTADIVLLIFAATVALVIVFVTVGVLTIEMLHPEADTTLAVEGVSHTMGIIVGVVVGYMLGRGRKESP
jgi:hypothetical protein